MNYRVRWDPDAFRTVRRIWVAANEPEAALAAFDEVERILSTDAERQGESPGGNRRILIVAPLGVIFRARQDVSEVLILDAWLIKKRPA